MSERRSERRSFSRERKVSAAQFFKKGRKVSAVHKNWRAWVQNTLFFSALFYCTLPVKLLKNRNFSSDFYKFMVFKIFFWFLHMHITVFRANQLYYYSKTACKEKSAEIRAALLPESASGSAFFFLASERERVRHFKERANALQKSMCKVNFHWDLRMS